ncbi:GTPase ObgE, partial [bacterium]|nr:GTPase ObgE [bacterium]
FGGPSGGNGGPGGSVYLVVDRNQNTLVYFRRKIHFKAERGGRGSSKNQQGEAGQDLFIPVPAGTVVYDADSGDPLADLLRAARGGRRRGDRRAPPPRPPALRRPGRPRAPAAGNRG